MSWQDCAYGNAGCSVAAGTWIAGMVALFAFAAACQAVAWASATYFIEIEPRLGQSLCPLHKVEDHPIHKEIFLVPQGQDQTQIVFRRPIDFDPSAYISSYYEYHSAFKNLGRTALADVDVDMRLVDEKGSKRSVPIRVHVGNVLCNEEVHVAFYASRVFEKLTVSWENASQAKPIGKGRASIPRFYSVDPSSDIDVYSLPDIQQIPLINVTPMINVTPAGGTTPTGNPPPPAPGSG
jgi:hypothetical protein